MSQATLLPFSLPAWCDIAFEADQPDTYFPICGLASEQSVAGRLFLRIDAPADGHGPAQTLLLAPDRIKYIEPLTDEEVRKRKLI